MSPNYVVTSEAHNPASQELPTKDVRANSTAPSAVNGADVGVSKLGGIGKRSKIGKGKGKVASDSQGGIKKARFRPGMLALREIKKMQ